MGNSNFQIISGVPRKPFKEVSIAISTSVVKLNATDVDGALQALCRLEGGPFVRMLYTALPTNASGMPFYSNELLELDKPEMDAIVATGGFILDASAGGPCLLWVRYYR